MSNGASEGTMEPKTDQMRYKAMELVAVYGYFEF